MASHRHRTGQFGDVPRGGSIVVASGSSETFSSSVNEGETARGSGDGAQLAPFEAARGRLPRLVSDNPLLDSELPANCSIDEHVAEMKQLMKLARDELKAAKDKPMRDNRDLQNLKRVDEYFVEGEVVRPTRARARARASDGASFSPSGVAPRRASVTSRSRPACAVASHAAFEDPSPPGLLARRDGQRVPACVRVDAHPHEVLCCSASVWRMFWCSLMMTLS